MLILGSPPQYRSARAATRMENKNYSKNSTSFESLRTPSHLRSGVLIRMSQSITNIFPWGGFYKILIMHITKVNSRRGICPIARVDKFKTK